MARVKGLTTQQFNHNSNLVMSTLDLTDFTDVKASSLSGGNKRKLSSALSLLVSPTLDFLDEPTSGVDPVSRRRLFKMIKELKQGSAASVVLTTHRMDEAELLCD